MSEIPKKEAAVKTKLASVSRFIKRTVKPLMDQDIVLLPADSII
jgi:hypothetical protein